MKIIYFTTAQDAATYKSFSLDRKLKTNSSNQVFNTNFIKCLALNNEVEVISCRSDKTQRNHTEFKTEGNIQWHYLKTNPGRLSNYFAQFNEVKRIPCKFVIGFVDTTNYRCLVFARKYCTKRNIPLVGIVTDNPYNISNQGSRKSGMILSRASRCDAFVCLTESLGMLFNDNQKPSILIKGLSRDVKDKGKSPVDAPYFFYAGTLMRKYGVYNLIRAYNSLKTKDVKLIIAGHHAESDLKAFIADNPNIIYLGNVPNDIILNYENHSIANLNPRPFSEYLDIYSVPSKIIEYSSKNSLIISSVSTPLLEEFEKTILWIDNENTLEKRLKDALEMSSEDREKRIQKQKEIFEENFSLEVNNKKLMHFISNVRK